MRAWILLALALSCGDEPKFGDRCESNSDCAEGGFCCIARECPGGLCTEECVTDDDCPGGQVCIDLAAGGRVCMLACSTTADCNVGTGLECVDRDGVRVCLNQL